MKKYTVSIDIDLPRKRVIELFDNSENLFKWQTGLQSYEHVSGEPGQPGAKSKMVFLSGKNRIEMTEEITERNLPDEFNGRYAWGGGSNTLKNRFIELEPNKTRWESTCDYSFTSLPMKIMSFLFPGKFREQNLMFLQNFKAFAENGISVQDSI